MNLDTHLFLTVNDFAKATAWLHGAVFGYATYGIALFAALLLAGWWSARRRADPARMAAALWAPLGMLLALGLNQPLSAAVGEPRPYSALS
ncbi:UDP-diphosphatase, partial [Amycolatopsis rhizosphaerae]